MWDTLQQIFKFMRVQQKYWLAPVMLLLLLMGGFLGVVEGSAWLAFIYAIF